MLGNFWNLVKRRPWLRQAFKDGASTSVSSPVAGFFRDCEILYSDYRIKGHIESMSDQQTLSPAELTDILNLASTVYWEAISRHSGGDIEAEQKLVNDFILSLYPDGQLPTLRFDG